MKQANSPISGGELLMRHMASSRFEAARQLDASSGVVSESNKFGRLHGHGFMVSAFVSPQDSLTWVPFPGGEVPALLKLLHSQAQRLDYQSVNDFVPQPSDINIARWFGEQLQDYALGGVTLQSTPDQGAVLRLGNASSDTLLWRRYRFQAAHQLPNVPTGHKCGRLHGHGFEVVLYAESSHESVDYDTLDLAWSKVSDFLSFRCLNDVAGLENPTSELLSSWIWERLKDALPSLMAVSVYETASCGATFDGERYLIWKDFPIDSAVRYRHASANNPLARVHGYTYLLRLNLSAPLDQVMGWTVDFGDVKEVFTPVFKALDHHPLHENLALSAVSDGDTGSMAKWLFDKAQALLPQLARVDMFESEGCGSSVGTNLQGPLLPLARVGNGGISQ